MHVAYEEAKKDAAEIGVAVTGSELVSFFVVANCSIFVMSKKHPLLYTGWPCTSCLSSGCCWVLHGEGGSDGPWGRPKGGLGHDSGSRKYAQWISRSYGSSQHQFKWVVVFQVHLAINRLGLSTLSPFNPKERVIKLQIEERKIQAWKNDVSRWSSTPCRLLLNRSSSTWLFGSLLLRFVH